MNYDISQLNDGEKKKVETVEKFIKDKDFALYEAVLEINESLKTLSEKETPQIELPEVPEKMKIEIDGIETVTLKGERGDTPKVGVDFEQPKDGKDYILTEKDKKEIASKIQVPIVEKIVETIIEKQPIVTNEIKEVALTDTPYQVRDKLESLDNESEKLKIDAIQNLREELDDLKKKWSSRPIFGGGGMSVSALNLHFYHDEVGTGDGVTTVFSLDHTPSPTNSLEVWIGTANLWITDDYTLSGTQITFLTAPPTGAKIRAKYRI